METNTENTAGPPVDLQRLVRLYDWLRMERQHGETIACGGIFPASEIAVGQRWQSSSGLKVTVTQTREIHDDAQNVLDTEVYYTWVQGDEEKCHSKLAFAFQCRYCLILPASTYSLI